MAAPGKAYREGLSLVELFRLFPDDAAAQAWLEEQRWGGEPWCPKCGSRKVNRDHHKSMPWRCAVRSCRKRFSVRVGTVLQGSHLGYRTWVLAIHLLTTSPRGQSSMKLHRDLNITQKSAWFLAHRIRKAFADQHVDGDGGMFSGPVEVDETHVGGKRANMSKGPAQGVGGGRRGMRHRRQDSRGRREGPGHQPGGGGGGAVHRQARSACLRGGPCG